MMSSNKVCQWRSVLFSYRSFRPLACHHRCLLHDGPGTLSDRATRYYENELRRRQALRRQVLSLYRVVIRASRSLMWPNPQGILWHDDLRVKAREAFELARFEKDPEIIARLLNFGTDKLQTGVDRILELQNKQLLELQNKRMELQMELQNKRLLELQNKRQVLKEAKRHEQEETSSKPVVGIDSRLEKHSPESDSITTPEDEKSWWKNALFFFKGKR